MIGHKNKSSLILLIACAVTLCLFGCSSNNLVGVYKLDRQQGNVLEQASIDQVKQGMTKAQVRYLLGNPLVMDPFHPERWDYVFNFRPGKGPAELKRLTLSFKGGKLNTIAGRLWPNNRTAGNS